ncbi:hypothetical protein BUE80_DR005716, partial [Diplocarpon rosae]
MRFTLSVFVPLAILVATAVSSPLSCTWPCWPFWKDSFKSVVCNGHRFIAIDTQSCYDQAKSLYFQNTKKKPGAMPELRTFPKVQHLSLGGSLPVLPYVTFPLVTYGPWGENETPGPNRCFLDSAGKLAGFFYIPPNFTEPITNQDIDIVPPYEPCT